MLQLQNVIMLEKRTIIVDNLSIRYYQSADFEGGIGMGLFDTLS